MRFRSRAEAARLLAERLAPAYAGAEGVVFALPPGGVVLGPEIARRLTMPLDVVIVCSIGHPDNPGYAIGAVTEAGDPVISRWGVAGVSAEWFQRRVAAERREARRRRECYLGGRSPQRATGRLAIVIDDSIATGQTMVAALRELRSQRPERLVVAVPVIPLDTVARIEQEADDIVALDVAVDHPGAAGAHYESFPPVTDEEVLDLLRANSPRAGPL